MMKIKLDGKAWSSEPVSMEPDTLAQLCKDMRESQVKREAELVASLMACGWTRSTIRFPLLHLATADEHRWAKVSFADIGCWKSPSGCVFLTRMDQYSLEVAESEAKTKSLSEPPDIEGLLAVDDE